MDREAISQVEAAKRLGVVQPRISEIARNKVDKLSLDYLVGLCAKAGVSVAVKLAAEQHHELDTHHSPGTECRTGDRASRVFH
jgi:plasmid maintenance system antidote protein VapI